MDKTFIIEDGDTSDEAIDIVAITSVDFDWNTEDDEVEIVVPLTTT